MSLIIDLNMPAPKNKLFNWHRHLLLDSGVQTARKYNQICCSQLSMVHNHQVDQAHRIICVLKVNILKVWRVQMDSLKFKVSAKGNLAYLMAIKFRLAIVTILLFLVLLVSLNQTLISKALIKEVVLFHQKDKINQY